MKTILAFIIILFSSYNVLAADIGFRLYRSSESGTYTYGSEYAVATTTRWNKKLTYENSGAGTYYFVLTAYKGTDESDPSNEVSDTLGDGESITFGWDEYNWGISADFLKLKFSVGGTDSVSIGSGGTGTVTISK